jgi:hypothetical protein
MPRNLFFAIAVSLVVATPLFAADPEKPERVEEYSLKAAFFWRFLQFSEWSHEADSFRVCVAGNAEVLPAFTALEKQTLRGESVLVQRISDSRGIAGCDALFVAADSPLSHADFIQAGRGRPILTVGEREGFAKGGGMIGLYFEGARLKFEVNLNATEEAGVKISSRLMKLARVVE